MSGLFAFFVVKRTQLTPGLCLKIIKDPASIQGCIEDQ